ncbi:hypothetical protein RR48_03329 [Papilio machaon]|uniref:Uncharacterized protein n=1 Tax=Papilio machaon TaxID=76193 RepID=A0A0N0PF47_PAPMA|nr:hypothetical protein RR48_03329 [Papilio machaon]
MSRPYRSPVTGLLPGSIRSGRAAPPLSIARGAEGRARLYVICYPRMRTVFHSVGCVCVIS